MCACVCVCVCACVCVCVCGRVVGFEVASLNNAPLRVQALKADIVELVAAVLDADNRAPTEPEVRAVLNAPPVKKVDVCVNDCVLYDRVHFADGKLRAAERLDRATKCPRCDEERYVDGSKRDRRNFWYFPMLSTFQRLFERPDFAAEVRRPDRRQDGIVEARSQSHSRARSSRHTHRT